MVIYGVDLDSEGRCRHYHTACDVVALKCSKCQEYFACYQCHNQLRNHPFESVSVKGPSATIKSHHNVGGLPDYMKLKIVEQLSVI